MVNFLRVNGVISERHTKSMTDIPLDHALMLFTRGQELVAQSSEQAPPTSRSGLAEFFGAGSNRDACAVANDSF